MLSQFIPVEPGSGGGRCCLQGRRCPSRILSNAYGGAVNTTAADGGGFSTVAIDKPIGFLCPNVVGVFSPSELSSVFTLGTVVGPDGFRCRPAGLLQLFFSRVSNSPEVMQLREPVANSPPDVSPVSHDPCAPPLDRHFKAQQNVELRVFSGARYLHRRPFTSNARHNWRAFVQQLSGIARALERHC